MMVLRRYYQKINQIPSAVKSFLFKGFLLFVAWKLIYLLFLQPPRVLDQPLTYFTGVSTAKMLNLITDSSKFTTQAEINEYDSDGTIEKQPVTAIFYQEQRVLSIADACNALELFVLYAGFIICFPSNIKRKIFFMIAGLVFICFINIFRCAGLTLIYIHYPQYGDFSHHFLFTFIVYACIFLLWWLYSKKPETDVKA